MLEWDEKSCCKELLLEFELKNKRDNSSKIHFELKEDDTRDIYNITAPFEIEGNFYIAGRVEDRDSESAEVIFFKKEDKGKWKAIKLQEEIHLQDPFVKFVNGLLIIGGVEVYPNPVKPDTLSYRTIFMKGTNLNSLERFTKGPEGMKDIRLLQLDEGKILVFTRPQGEDAGRGTIGYTVIKSLEELTIDTINKAKLLKGQFKKEEWGGANQLHLLKNGKIGVLSHIASFDEEGNRHYYSSTFCFDLETEKYSKMKLIAIRDNFAKGASKRTDLEDVIFSGGLVRKENGKAKLYCGVGDAEGHSITIEDPFIEYEM